VEVDGVDLARYFTFSVAGEEYGISVLAVREILECGTVRRVPRTPAFIRGVIDLRGRAVPVVDLAARFGLARGAAGRPASVVIVEVEVEGQRVVVGLMADAVNGFLTGMGRAGRRRVPLLDADRLLSPGEARQLAAVSAGREDDDGSVAARGARLVAGRKRRRGGR